MITCGYTYPSGWYGSVVGDLASRIVEQGVVVTFPSGSYGDSGGFAMGGGGTGQYVLTVGAAESGVWPGTPFTVNTRFPNGTDVSSELAYLLDRPIPNPESYLGWPIKPVSLEVSEGTSL